MFHSIRERVESTLILALWGLVSHMISSLNTAILTQAIKQYACHLPANTIKSRESAVQDLIHL